MATTELNVLLDGIVFGEGPRWHAGKLWFSDIHAKKVMNVDEGGHTETVATIPGNPSGLGFLPDGRLLIVSMEDRLLLRLDAPGELTTVADLSGLVHGQLNDMVVDRVGRAYIGSMGFDFFKGEEARPGNVVLVQPDGSARVVAEDMNFPNGPVITADGRTYVVAESMARRLTAFDIDAGGDGSLRNRRVFAETAPAVPDGIAIDSADAIWISSPSTAEFLRIVDGGAVTERIPVPGRMAIACEIGGHDGHTLFLLTSKGDIRAGQTASAIETVRVEVGR